MTSSTAPAYITRMKWPLMILVGMLGLAVAGPACTAGVLAVIHIATWGTNA